MIAIGKLLSLLTDDVPVEEAFEAVAIQLTNGFEVNLPSMSGRAVYPMISYVNHSCVPNVAHSHKMISHDKGKIVLKAIQVYLRLGAAGNLSNWIWPATKRLKRHVTSDSFLLLLDYDKQSAKQQFFMELKVQRMIPAGTELTIRYTSVFEVIENTSYEECILLRPNR